MPEKNHPAAKRTPNTKPAVSPPTRPRPAAPGKSGVRKPVRAAVTAKAPPRRRTGREIALYAVLGGIALGLIVAFAYGLSTPKSPWAFDRPEAQLPSLQPHHTLQ